MDAPNDPSSVPPSVPATPPPAPLVPPTPPPAPTPIAAAVLPPVDERPHSGLGITSLVIAIIVAIGLFVVFAVAGFLHHQGRGPRDPATMLVGLLTIALLFVDIVALGLGIGALCQKNRRKLMGVLGVVISGCIFLGTIGLMLIGLAMKHRMQG